MANGGVGDAVAAQHGDQRLADAERRERLGDVVELGARKRAGGRAQRLLVVGRERAQRVLHPVAELREHVRRDVLRALRDEEDADALRADQPHHLLDLLEERLARVVEQQVRLVEEEHELGLLEIADLGQLTRRAARASTS